MDDALCGFYSHCIYVKSKNTIMTFIYLWYREDLLKLSPEMSSLRTMVPIFPQKLLLQVRKSLHFPDPNSQRGYTGFRLSSSCDVLNRTAEASRLPTVRVGKD